MSRKCALCNKSRVSGSSITRRGMAKAKGGVGQKITGIAKRNFSPNLQVKKAVIDGRVQRVLVCAKCIKSGNLVVPVRKPAVPER